MHEHRLSFETRQQGEVYIELEFTDKENSQI